MLVEFFVVPIAGCLLLLIAAWRALSALASALHWSAWAPAAVIAGFVATLLGLGLRNSRQEKLRMRREREEQLEMEQRYPGCDVLRLSNGDWFLTDRSTGREYQPTEAATVLRH
ncbi:hypothetical protein [Paraburkholderia caledonica]|uniref:hypothetical protein n=1 Tax=Paraburkholderia caledonica TaxID=134536 RepID=UPI0038BBEBEC